MIDSLNILYTDDSIAHYGVMGMKWGVRKQRAQAAGMSVRDYKKQIKADNKKAFELGRDVTIAERLNSYTQKKADKQIAKALKGKESKRKQLKMARAYANKAKAQELLKKTQAAVEAHRKELVKKYGDTSISQIKRDKKGRINEKIHTAKDYAVAAGATAIGTLAGTVGLAAINAPIRMFYLAVPASKNQEAYYAYQMMNAATKQEVKYKK